MYQNPTTFRLNLALTKIAMVTFLTCCSDFLFAMENPPTPSQFPMESLIGIDGEPFSTGDIR
ncbi:hypothetical protein, partial [Algoriphagus boritolerans]